MVRMARRVHPVALEPLAILLEVFPDGRHDDRAFSEQSQGVGDVGGDAAPPSDQAVDQEGQAEAIEPVGQDVVAKAAGEGHQVVEGDGTGQDEVHADCVRARVSAKGG